MARQRCSEVLDLPSRVTLWRMTDGIEDAFEARWEDWLDAAPDWRPFFEAVARISSPDVNSALRGMGLVDEDDFAVLEDSEGRGRRTRCPGPGPVLGRAPRAAALLALGFAKGAPSTLVVPYARQADDLGGPASGRNVC